ncbi:hypothetical protein C5167_020065 [Papaver somniferum]|uniref:Ferrochelatase n=1 Tax=Papaver somniferum TaxID=3469 RepID=A0A4Y7IRZ2_PAPSO|nr:hypothetical protein C5167_020065 [Papaver somniferum]
MVYQDTDPDLAMAEIDAIRGLLQNSSLSLVSVFLAAITPLVSMGFPNGLPGCINAEVIFDSMANLIEQELQKFSNPEKVMMLFSAHGVPVSYVEDTGDPYRISDGGLHHIDHATAES